MNYTYLFNFYSIVETNQFPDSNRVEVLSEDRSVDINAPDVERWPLLPKAFTLEHSKYSQLLLGNVNIDLNVKLSHQEISLDCIIQNNHNECIDAFLARQDIYLSIEVYEFKTQLKIKQNKENNIDDSKQNNNISTQSIVNENTLKQ